MNTGIEAVGLTKTFASLTAANDVSFKVEGGQIYGLLGPNGAGKTTTLRMLSGLLTPSAGSAYIQGINMQSNKTEARKKLGFLTGEMDLYRRLKPKEVLTYFGKLYQVDNTELEIRISRLMEVFGINEFKDRMCEKLSTGQKQRVSIARTLVHDPSVVILDEPTTGLDIMASEFILSFIQKIAREDNKTVIFSTHNLTEVERLCDQIGILRKGNLIYDGAIDNVLALTHQSNLSDAFFQLVNNNPLA